MAVGAGRSRGHGGLACGTYVPDCNDPHLFVTDISTCITAASSGTRQLHCCASLQAHEAHGRRVVSAQFEVTDTSLAFPLPPTFNSCALYCAGVAKALGGHAAKGSTASELVVEGALSLRLPIGAYGTTVGWAALGGYAARCPALLACARLRMLL